MEADYNDLHLEFCKVFQALIDVSSLKSPKLKKELAKHRKLKFAQGILKNQCFKFTKILKDILVVACGIRTSYLIDFLWNLKVWEIFF